MRRIVLSFFALIFLAGLLLSCGEATKETETAVPPTSPTVQSAVPTSTPEPDILDLDIKGFLFRPETVTVTVGTTVRWTNLDDIQHSVTSGTPDNPDGRFDSGFFVQNEQFAYTFTEPGEYPYFCMRHTHMQATIVVVEE